MDYFNNLIYSVYDAALLPEKWPDALELIGGLFNAEGAVIIFYSGNAPADFIFSPGLQDAVRVYIDEEWWRRDIHAQRAIERHMTSGDVLSDFTLATQEETETLPIYADFFQRVGFGRLMFNVMLPDLDMLVALSVPRARWKGSFTDNEMATLRAIGRHVEQSLRISLRLANLEATQSVLLSALDVIEAGIYALDGEGRLVLTNKAGREQLANHFAVADGHMRPLDEPAQARFAALVAAAGQPERGNVAPTSLILAGKDGRKIVVFTLPITPAGRERLDMSSSASTLLLTTPVERNHLIDPTVLRDIFDLSLGEARLAALIGGGMAVREAAGRLGVTEGTARVVLKRVFRKLGISRQAELVLQLSALGGVKAAGASRPDRPSE